MANLTPAANFQVKNLKGYKLIVPGGYVLMSGYGIFDLAAKAFVCMNGKIETAIGTFAKPYSLTRKSYAVEACSKGLYDGYTLIDLVKA